MSSHCCPHAPACCDWPCQSVSGFANVLNVLAALARSCGGCWGLVERVEVRPCRWLAPVAASPAAPASWPASAASAGSVEQSQEQWWKGRASTGIFMLWSTSAASAGSVVQSHKQWWNGSRCIYVIIDHCCIHWICETKPWAMIYLSASVASAWPAKKGKCNSKIGHSWMNLLKWLYMCHGQHLLHPLNPLQSLDKNDSETGHTRHSVLNGHIHHLIYKLPHSPRCS